MTDWPPRLGILWWTMTPTPQFRIRVAIAFYYHGRRGLLLYMHTNSRCCRCSIGKLSSTFPAPSIYFRFSFLSPRQQQQSCLSPDGLFPPSCKLYYECNRQIDHFNIVRRYLVPALSLETSSYFALSGD